MPMTSHRVLLVAFSLCLCLVYGSGCSDDHPTGGADASDTNGVTDTGNGGFLGREPTSAETEWADCIAGCGHIHQVGDLINLTSFNLDGLQGMIDDRDHTYYRNAIPYYAADIDVLALQLPGRRMFEVIVEPYGAGSQMIPAIGTITFEGNYTFASSNLSDSNHRTRTVLAAPYVHELPIFLAIQHSRNFTNWESGGPFFGGEDYRYVIRFDTWEFNPVELGELTASNSPIVVRGAELEVGGDIHYYRFSAPATANDFAMPTVTLTRTGSNEYFAFILGMKTIGGDLTAHRSVIDESNSGTLVLGPGSFMVCGPTPCEGLGEYIFAVTDYNGLASPGAFTYDLSIHLP